MAIWGCAVLFILIPFWMKKAMNKYTESADKSYMLILALFAIVWLFVGYKLAILTKMLPL
ncbi:TPA: hypothetical protein ACJEU7_001463 [Acinetobacter baumannii]|uniref:hypothetical protein n=1 Tax=Acinetobacter baumannii TaxID=470 RepID=UPI00124A9FE0|nr:hypothetical protein [Acinetobacter baumannii]KAB1665013.1 hypothetical protein F8B05_19590 [Acinetobacter baumannii]MCX3035308.1 hypothetical protein [Acinetobacter baumannii]